MEPSCRPISWLRRQVLRASFVCRAGKCYTNDVCKRALCAPGLACGSSASLLFFPDDFSCVTRVIDSLPVLLTASSPPLPPSPNSANCIMEWRCTRSRLLLDQDRSRRTVAPSAAASLQPLMPCASIFKARSFPAVSCLPRTCRSLSFANSPTGLWRTSPLHLHPHPPLLPSKVT